jgi:hypothetical protein
MAVAGEGAPIIEAKKAEGIATDPLYVPVLCREVTVVDAEMSSSTEADRDSPSVFQLIDRLENIIDSLSAG